MSAELGLGMVLEIIEAYERWMEFSHTLNRWITGHHGTADPVLLELGRIHAELSQLQGQELAAWATHREESLALLQAHSSVSLQTIHGFIQSGAELTDPHWAPRLALAERDSLLAVHALVNNIDTGYWLRPDSIGAISWSGDPTSYEHGWMPHFNDRPQRNGLGQVWDYRWALPAATYAITCRLAVLRAVVTNREIARHEVGAYATFAAEVFRRIESGIRALVYDQISALDLQRLPIRGEVPIAVVDIHGGYFVGGLFWADFRESTRNRPPYPMELPNLPLPRQFLVESYSTNHLIANHRILTGHFRNHVAHVIGLPDILWFAGQLEQLHNKLHEIDRIIPVDSDLYGEYGRIIDWDENP